MLEKHFVPSYPHWTKYYYDEDEVGKPPNLYQALWLFCCLSTSPASSWWFECCHEMRGGKISRLKGVLMAKSAFAKDGFDDGWRLQSVCLLYFLPKAIATNNNPNIIVSLNLIWFDNNLTICKCHTKHLLLETVTKDCHFCDLSQTPPRRTTPIHVNHMGW